MSLFKRIYEGYAEGFYESARFELFMYSNQFSSIGDVAQTVTDTVKDNGDIVYSIKPFGLQVRYQRHGEEVEVFAHGTPEKVKWIEGVINQEAGARGF